MTAQLDVFAQAFFEKAWNTTYYRLQIKCNRYKLGTRTVIYEARLSRNTFLHREKEAEVNRSNVRRPKIDG